MRKIFGLGPKPSKTAHEHKLRKLPRGYTPNPHNGVPVPDGTLVMLAIVTAHGFSTAGPKRAWHEDSENPASKFGVLPEEWAVPAGEFGAIAGFLPVAEPAPVAENIPAHGLV